MFIFMPKLIRYILLVGAAVASIMGLAVAVYVDYRLLLMFYLITFSFATIALCFMSHQETQQFKADAKNERGKREDIEEQLKRLPLEGLQSLYEAIAQTNLHQTASTLAELADFLGRMASLDEVEDTAFDVRTVEASGNALYVIAKVSENANGFLKPGDQFFLTRNTSSKVDHPVAIVKITPNFKSKNRSVGLQLVAELEEEYCGAIKGFARESVNLAGLKGLKVKTMIDVDEFKGVDMRNASKAIPFLKQLLENSAAGGGSDEN